MSLRLQKTSAVHRTVQIVLFILAVILPLIRYTPYASGSDIPQSRCKIVSVETFRYYTKAETLTDDGSGCIVFLPSNINAQINSEIHTQKILQKTAEINPDYYLRNIKYVHYFEGNDIIVNSHKQSIISFLRSATSKCILSLYSGESAGIVSALLTGNRKLCSPQTINIFTRSGTLHLLSASGLHVGIAASLPLFILPFFIKRKKIYFSAAAVFIALFLAVTDMPVSLVRASVMFFISVALCIAERRSSSLNILFLSGLLITVFSPHEFFSTGFQLSFLATMGIILFYRRFTSVFAPAGYLKSSLSMTFSSQVFVFPLIAFKLSQVNLCGVFSNIIMVPLYSIILPACGLSVAINNFMPAPAGFLAVLTDYILKFSLKAAGFFASSGTHFTLKSAFMPVAVFAAGLIPMFLNIFKNIKYLSLTILILTQIIIFASLRYQNHAYLESDNKYGNLTISIGSGVSTVRGNFDNFSCNLLEENLNSLNFSALSLIPDKVNGETILNCRKLISKHNTLSITFPRHSFSRNFIDLLEICEKENIKVKIISINKFLDNNAKSVKVNHH